MTQHLIKYLDQFGRYRPVDEANDVFGLKGIRLGGVLFDETNITQTSVTEAIDTRLTDLEALFSGHVYQQDLDLALIRATIQSLNESISLLGLDITAILNDNPLEETIETVGGETILTTSTIQWSIDNAEVDVVVYRNGMRLVQDQTGGTGADYRKVSSNQIEIFRTALAEDRYTFRSIRQLLSIKPKSYFYGHTDGRSGKSLPLPNRYAPNTDQLSIFRNGILSIKSYTLGSSDVRYEETSPTFITFEDLLVSDDVVSYLNTALTPKFRYYQQGVTGTVLTIPSYIVGNDGLKVWRNGVLMNTSSMGSTFDQYSETSTTQVTLAEPAVATDLFIFEDANTAPQFREDITGISGTVITLSNSYTVGDDRLLVFRNGKLLYKSTTIGDPIDRYLESGTSEITLEIAVDVTDWISVIYL